VLFLRQLYLEHVLNFVRQFFPHGLLLLFLDILLTAPPSLAQIDYSRNYPDTVHYSKTYNYFLPFPDVIVTSHPPLIEFPRNCVTFR